MIFAIIGAPSELFSAFAVTQSIFWVIEQQKHSKYFKDF